MKPPPFRFESPDTLEDALSVLAEYGDDAKVIAGGQSLMPLLAFRLARPELIVDLGGLASMRYISRAGETLTLGAMITHREVELNAGIAIPQAIRSAVGQIGHVAIRNRGTVGGSLAHADPSAEWAALALAYDGVIVASSSTGERRIPADEFFVDLWTTALRADEIVRELVLHLPAGVTGAAFLEYAPRHGDFAVAGVCAVLSADPTGRLIAARLAVIGAAPVATRCRRAEAVLQGEQMDADVLARIPAMVTADVEPRGGSEDERRYRVHAAGVLARRAVREAARQIDEAVLDHG